jgi:anti-sigma regulatory factor (Ser/Thr protein kinase)
MAQQDQQSEVEVDLPQDLTAAHAARAATRSVLGSWRLGALLDPVLLTVSELVGNAVRHGRPPVGLSLRRSERGVRVKVHDEAKTAPSTGAADESAESGRGLHLVEAMSTDTGVDQIDGDGKDVWAQIDLPEGQRPADSAPC